MLITGISLEFATIMFRSWLEEKDIGSITTALKKAQLDSRMLVGSVNLMLLVFRSLLEKKDIGSITTALKKAQLDSRMLVRSVNLMLLVPHRNVPILAGGERHWFYHYSSEKGSAGLAHAGT